MGSQVGAVVQDAANLEVTFVRDAVNQEEAFGSATCLVVGRRLTFTSKLSDVSRKVLLARQFDSLALVDLLKPFGREITQ